MKRLLDWLLGVAIVAIMLSAYAHMQANDEWADARRDAEVKAEIMELIDGMK